MCGITGWVDYERNLQDRSTVIQAMTDTMALRGPDAQGVWIDRHVALGHRRLSVIDLQGGAQPMNVSHDGKTRACLTYSGEVYNFVELREDLVARGHRFHTRSDTEVVLRSYLEWGEDFVDRLVGIYALAIWDVRQQALLLVRDRMGVKPLFYQPFGHGVLFGSEPKAILAHPDVSARVGLDGLRQVLTNFAIPGRAIYDGMYEVKPGHVVRVSRDGLAARCYWKLEALEHEDSIDQTISTVRDHFERIVAQQTVADVPLCSLLSGGLDSSFVTAIADRVLRQRGGSGVRSYSVDFADHGVGFVPDAQRDTSDTPFVREFVKQMRTRHTEVVLDNEQVSSASVRGAVMNALDDGWSLGSDMYPSLYLLFAEVRKTSTVALSGEAADEVFGGYRWFHSTEAVNAATFPWLRGRDGLPSVLSERVKKALCLSEYVADSYAHAIDAVPALPGQTGHEKRMREIGFLGLTHWLPLLLDRKDRLSMAVGLEVRVPFCDHELVQYVFNTPWAMKTFDGREKSLLRAAAADIVPNEILQRVKSPYPATQDPAYERALRLQLEDFMSTAPEVVRRVFDETALRRLVEKPLGETSFGGERGNVDHALAISHWLKAYDVELSV